MFPGHVGAPLPCNSVKLVDVPEMNYLAVNGEGEVKTQTQADMITFRSFRMLHAIHKCVYVCVSGFSLGMCEGY